MMQSVCLFLLAFAALAAAQESKHWAVLVAGSNNYYNYRHQADLCHAYQILHAHGVPDERIIVFMYDDIAENPENPTKGIIINRLDGPDVYHGVPKDYTGREVTPDNFLNVLTGNKEAMAGKGSGKVLESGPRDHVFINFVDHGAPGFVAFPTQTLTAKRLMSAIMTMHEKKMYHQLVFYMEACESGSMFANGLLPDNINVFATTAANPHESSYACYYDKKRRTFLGDVYSVKWMENSDKVGLTETLQQQYEVVKKETNTSHVMEYGDMSFKSEQISEFLAGGNSGHVFEKLRDVTAPTFNDACAHGAVPAPMVPLAILFNRLQDAETEAERVHLRLKLMEELELRNSISNTMKLIVNSSVVSAEQGRRVLTAKAEPRDFECAEVVVNAFSEKCYNVGQVDYALRQVYALVNLCEEGISPDTIIGAISSTCKRRPQRVV